ncbi:RNA polymerase sigma factor [Sorangium sp. So ce119]|uniref:RNA polymerase sigma factor n=1 Tax=Sorangium sp. So ce119 TaxID=3133279 RepID=UPI003F5E159D
MTPGPDTPADDEGRPADEDAPLLDRFLAGDRAAFDELVLRHRDSLRRLVRRYVRSEDDAEDVTQRALLRALEKLGTFRRESTFRTWIHRIAVHLALNHLRGQRSAAPGVELDELPAFTSALETNRLVAAEVWARVARRLTELPPKQRLAVELRLFHELSFQEIAALSDCSEDSAKANFHHGIKRLRGLIPDPAG